MTGILAAAARGVIGVVLVLAVLAAMGWAAYGPRGAWTLAWLAVIAAVVTGAVLAWYALPRGPS